MYANRLASQGRNMKSNKVKVLSVAVLVCLALAGCGSRSTSPKNIASLALGKAVIFNTPQTSILTSGWSGNEPWGTWSDGKIAILNLVLDPGDSKALTLALDSHAFLAKGHESIKVDVLANTVKITTMSYTPTDKTTIRDLVIPTKALVAQPGHLKLTFVIRSPVSPKSLGLSADARQLGIGLVSIELIKAN